MLFAGGLEMSNENNKRAISTNKIYCYNCEIIHETLQCMN